ncbi:twin-arginine translocase subunit TatC [Clostridium sp. DJ247]|uniref:twin-arginine translocase subunit TatC n=1 Tax=Clostridium sp. DJ247 TaxID=2726188 RepID=UPI0016266BCA|nr:twin-arginine translocase subunit TatC [Clostridium sp. DJ247]MBC2580092.1 preprotein translocase subunit TatC [Clostridium sp. DJ247]
MVKSEQIVGIVRFLEKFRKAIIAMVIIVIIAASLVYSQAEYVINILTIPLNGARLYFMTPVEGMIAKMRVAFFGGIVISSPILAYIIIYIASSNLSKKIRRILCFVIVPLASLLFIAGILFGYKFLFSSTIGFLLDSGDDFMKANLSGNHYFSFVGTLMLTVGILFELPLVLIALSRIKIINSKVLIAKRKFAIMFSLITVALVSPTVDAFTFILISLPIIALYEISIWCIYLLERADRKKEALR